MTTSRLASFLRRGRRVALLIGAVQALVISIGWYVMYVTTHEQVAEGVEEIIVQNNERMARSIIDTIGVVDGDLGFQTENWERAQSVIEKVELGSGGFACIIDQSGNIVCHPEIRNNPGLLGISLSGHLFADMETGAEVPLETLPGGIASGHMRFLFDGKHYVATQLVNADGVRLLVHQPVSGLTAASQHITRGLIFQALVVGALITGLTILVVYLITRAHNAVVIKWNEELDEKVRRRTMWLKEALQEAEAASRAKSEFLANMSHEIRTPLNGVLGICDVLKDTPLAAEQEELLTTMRQSGEGLLMLLGDLLEYSQLSSGQTELRRERVDVRDIVAASLDLVRADAQAKELAVAVDVADDTPETITGDAGRLQQVLLHLLRNAVKFTPKGSIALRVRRQDESLRFEVADTGIGIETEARQRIFEFFQQADGSSTRRFGGVGLGLSISSELVARMGSHIEVESEPHKGSTFAFALPIVPWKAERVDTIPAPLPTKGAEPSDEDPPLDLRVLVAEDNPVNQRVIVRILEKLGCKVEVAWNGVEAVEQVKRHEFDAVLMDIQMPEMDGHMATREIRSLPNAADLPIIAVTAHALPADREEALDAGMNEYLTKPVRTRELRQALAVHTAGRTKAS